MSHIKKRSFNKVTGVTPTPSLRNIFNRDDTPDPSPIKERIVIGRAPSQLVKKAIDLPKRPESQSSSESSLPAISPEELPCSGGNCKTSPPKRYIERIVEPTPPPIVQKIVSRLPTPEPSIIEVIIKKPCPNKENLIPNRPASAQSLLRRSNSLVSERKNLIPPPPLPVSTSCAGNNCKVSPPKRYIERIVEPTPEPIIKRIVTRLPTPEPSVIEVVVKKPLARSCSFNNLKMKPPTPARPPSGAKLIRNNSFRVSRKDSGLNKNGALPPISGSISANIPPPANLPPPPPSHELPPLPPPPVSQPSPPPVLQSASAHFVTETTCENACNNCLVSPPKHTREVIREPTPEPIIKRVVTRLQTPEPDIIERVIVKKPPRVIIEKVTEQPRKPPPIIIEKVEYEIEPCLISPPVSVAVHESSCTCGYLH